MVEYSKKLLKENLLFFAQNFPNFLNIFKKYNIEKYPYNIEIENNEFVIYYNGERISGLKDSSNERVDKFEELVTFLFIDIFYNDKVFKTIDKITNENWDQYIDDKEFLLSKVKKFMILGLMPIFHIEKILLKLKKGVELHIFEPDFGVFLIFLSLVDIKTLFLNAKKLNIDIHFHIDENFEVLGEVFKEKLLIDFKNGEFTGYFISYRSEKINRVEEIFLEYYERELLGLDKFFLKTIVNNFTENFKNKDLKILSPNKIYNNDIKAVVIGSGPSLDENLNFLKENQDNLVIFALSSAVRPLIKNSIKPDFIFLIDPMLNLDKLNIFEGIEKELKDVILIGSITTDPNILKLFKKDFIAFFDLFILLFDELLFSKKYPINTVLNFAINFLFEIKVKEISLIGVDLGTKNVNRLHSKDYFKDDDRLRNFKVVKGVEGDVYMPLDFYVSKLIVEDMVKDYNKNNDYRLYNFSKGAVIFGFEQRDFKDLCKIKSSKNDAVKYIEQIFDRELKNMRVNKERLLSIQNLLKASIKRIEKIVAALKTKNLKKFEESSKKLVETEKINGFLAYILDVYQIAIIRKILYRLNFVKNREEFFKTISIELEDELSDILKDYALDLKKLVDFLEKL